MKRALLVACLGAALVSCATLFPPALKFNYNFADTYGDGLVAIQVTGLQTGTEVLSGGKPTGLDLSIRNLSPETIRVVWDKSIIRYNGISHKIYLSTMRFNDAGKAVPDAYIFANSKGKATVYPADNVRLRVAKIQDWTIDPIDSKEMACDVTIIVRGEERNYHVDASLQPPPPASGS